ncbi:hypothetical protein CIP107539_01798 [Corynebacterium diphtheriae]|nr:hypothetical protein CIP101352_01642 [Corynebacterium diphtheriae]CAB0563190.1 hypothetical protein CIP107518_01639 [Corynebacterium diphtheriae]CAB0612094.1 hypothetical protein CIP107539_01798 [Corynebacterium diphtheriae]CAB0653608.1 hypothetical protein CIP107561_01477 [Corynebacterium diphtheriae]
MTMILMVRVKTALCGSKVHRRWRCYGYVIVRCELGFALHYKNVTERTVTYFRSVIVPIVGGLVMMVAVMSISVCAGQLVKIRLFL